MTPSPSRVKPDDDLSVAAQIMWEGDYGIVPVVDDHEAVVGLITDRDVCMAAYLSGRPLSALQVGGSMSRQVIACGPEDSLSHAEALMREHRVRRLPVVGMQGLLLGMLTLNDLARAAAEARWPDRSLAPDAIEATLAAVGEPRRRSCTR